MAKLTCLLALFVVVVVCAEAIRIDTSEEGEVRPIPGVQKKHPVCKGRTGLFVNPKNCRKYVKCVRGDGQDKTCPRDFKFDSRRHCISPKQNPDCKDPGTQRGPTDADVVCPKARGMFVMKSDCHKYMMCKDFVPSIRNCKKGWHFTEINGICIKGDKCPRKYSEAEGEKSVCTKANELLPGPNCRKYIKCVNFKAQTKDCPTGMAYDSHMRTCTKKAFKTCKNNEIRSIEPDDE